MWSFIFSVKYCGLIIYSSPRKFILVVRGCFCWFVFVPPPPLVELPDKDKKPKQLDCFLNEMICFQIKVESSEQDI